MPGAAWIKESARPVFAIWRDEAGTVLGERSLDELNLVLDAKPLAALISRAARDHAHLLELVLTRTTSAQEPTPAELDALWHVARVACWFGVAEVRARVETGRDDALVSLTRTPKAR